MQNNKIYARCNENGCVTSIFSEKFEQPLPTDYLIDKYNTDRHGHQKYQVLDEYGCYNYEIKNGTLTIRNKTNDLQNIYNTNLRQQRSKTCFEVINRGKLWYDQLTTTQLAELKDWYSKWLDVTKTRIIPTKPIWLK